jgi:lipopolysaccharide/colanic/teichoic acid biosynthesis glycosyltransferase
LIEERAKYKIFDARPGITGLAQISNIDMSTPRLLAQTDALMLRGLTLKSYFIYIFKTILGGGAGDVVSKK